MTDLTPEGLRADFTSIGLSRYHIYSELPDSYAGLFRAVALTRNIGCLPIAENAHPMTELGHIALDLCLRHVQFGNIDNECCPEAESLLQSSLAAETVHSGSYRSPTIVIDAGEPVGVIKSLGEQTCYGLADRPEKGIYAKAFSSPRTPDRLSGWASQHLKSDEAWTIPLDEVDAEPIRFSVLAVPLESRNGLVCDMPQQSNVHRTSHEEIHETTAMLMQTARPIEYNLSPRHFSWQQR